MNDQPFVQSSPIDESMALATRHGQLMDELTAVRNRMAELHPMPGQDYRIALRPDWREKTDPMRHETRLDDIVVRNVAMFRAEQMDTHSWWVCCYLDHDTMDRICWNVSANARPKRLDWVTTEYPASSLVYEHELKD